MKHKLYQDKKRVGCVKHSQVEINKPHLRNRGNIWVDSKGARLLCQTR